MVALTPNFQLPYAQSTDPADIPLRMQELAEAIDTKLHAQELRARPRYMAQFLGTVPNVIAGTATLGSLTWQTTDFNTFYPDFFPQPAVGPLTDPSTTALAVNLPGFWFIFGSVQVPSTVASANIDELGCEILVNGSASPQRCRSSTHETTTANDPTHLVDASAGVLLAPGDTVGLRAIARRSSGNAPVTFGRRSITLLRMTQS
jgi:hypothetical protein